MGEQGAHEKKDPGNYGLVSVTAVDGKVMQQIILESISKHLMGKKVIGFGSHRVSFLHRGYVLDLCRKQC